MKEFFTTTIGAWDDGSVRLTAPGIAVVVVIIALLVVVAAVIRHRNAEKKTILTTKQLVYSAVAIALAVVCSMIKFANLPMGGSVTLFSMLFIALIGYSHMPRHGTAHWKPCHFLPQCLQHAYHARMHPCSGRLRTAPAHSPALTPD